MLLYEYLELFPYPWKYPLLYMILEGRSQNINSRRWSQSELWAASIIFY